MKIERTLTQVLQVMVLFYIGLLSAHSAVQGGPHPERQKAGTIQVVELNRSSLIVDGIRYHVALDARIEIGGSYGGYTMLKVGMKIDFTYQDISMTQREIVRIQQIPDQFRLEEA